MKTISYNLAKAIHDKAEEKGVKLPESEWQYDDYSGTPKLISRKKAAIWSRLAYTTDELLEILPSVIKLGEHDNPLLSVYKLKDCYWVGYDYEGNGDENTEGMIYIEEKTPYEALGNLYLYLIDKGLIK